MQNMSAQDRAFLVTEVTKRLEKEKNAPFVISIMGQTGVGKSSLINALFNTNLKTDPIRPTTKEVEAVAIKGAAGSTLIFNDMPGIGESENADTSYMTTYRKYLLDSDVVLWAIYADNRSVTFDTQALQRLLSGLDSGQQGALMSKITFVLTKADVLHPSPWVIVDMGSYASIAPSRTTQEIFFEKEKYYQEKFILPHGANILSWTYNDVKFALRHPAFTYTEHSICYNGLLTRDKVRDLKQQYPQYGAVFDRLYDNYRVIPCSSLFKYNLNQLMLIIINKLGPSAIERFKQHIHIDSLDRVSLEQAYHMCNVVIMDTQRRKVFDLADGIFPVSKRTRLF